MTPIRGRALVLIGCMAACLPAQPPQTGAAPPPKLLPRMYWAMYEGEFDKVPDFAKVTPTAAGRADTFDLDALVGAIDHFAIAFEAEVEISTAGDYRFALESDDGSRLLVDGELVVDNDGRLDAPRRRVGRVELDRGRHEVRVEFFQRGGKRRLDVAVEGPLRAVAGAAEGPESATLWFRAPAEGRAQALPVGNGALATMVRGAIERERLPLRAIATASGDDRAAAPISQRVRSALAPRSIESHLEIAFALPAGDVTGYARSLDVQSAVASTTFRLKDVTHYRDVFASRSARVLAVHCSADRPGSVSLSFGLQHAGAAGRRRPVERRDLVGGVAISGRTDDIVHPGGRREPGRLFRSVAHVDARGGTVRVGGGRVHVTGADAVTLWTTSVTDRGGADLAARCDARIARCKEAGVAVILREHMVEHGSRQARVRLTIPGGPAPRLSPTDVRLKALREGAADASLAALVFDLGRYLLIATAGSAGDAASLRDVEPPGGPPTDTAQLDAALRAALSDNLLDRRLAGAAPLAATDATVGAAATIAAMLVRSRDDEIELLPALPATWPNGELSGLPMRGGFEVDVRWRSGRLVSAQIRSSREQPCRVRAGVSLRVTPDSGAKVTERAVAFVARPGTTYEFRPGK